MKIGRNESIIGNTDPTKIDMINNVLETVKVTSYQQAMSIWYVNDRRCLDPLIRSVTEKVKSGCPFTVTRARSNDVVMAALFPAP